MTTAEATVRISLALDSEDLAEHYEQISLERQFRAGQALLDAAGLAEGEAVLDLGCGTGLLTAHIAERVGQTGRVIGVDPLGLRIALAQRKSGLHPNLEFQVGDAADLARLAPGTFDLVVLNAVLHWLPDKPAGLRAIARVLRPGGRVAISTGSREHPSARQAVKTEVLSGSEFHAHFEDGNGTQLGVSAAELDLLLREAGFDPVRIEIRPNAHVHASGEAAVRFAEASSFGNFLGHLPVGLRERARALIVGGLERSRTERGVSGGGARLVAVAVIPSKPSAPNFAIV